jgi:arsenate reductase
MLTFICYTKCSTCQKAKAFLDSHEEQYEIRDIKTDNPTYDELKEWLTLSGLPVRKLFNTSGLLYKSLELKDKLPTMSEDDCLKLLATDGMLVKRPLLVDADGVLVGFKNDEWETALMKTAMKRWENVTETFSDAQRHYKNMYLETCEVYDEIVEVSLFSSIVDSYEIYFSYGIFYGIIYVDKENAVEKYETVKKELELEYRQHKDPTATFINEFAEKHEVALPSDILFDFQF